MSSHSFPFSLCFSSFDERAGPIPIWYTGINLHEANSVAYSSQLVLAMSQITDATNGIDAILPFSKLELTGYIYLFLVESPEAKKKEPALSSLVLLVPNSVQSTLYYLAPQIREKATAVANKIKLNWFYKRDYPLSESLIATIKLWGQEALIMPAPSSSQEQLEGKYSSDRGPQGDITFLLSQFGDNIAAPITSILTGTQVIVTGNESLVKITIDSLQLIVTYRTLKIIPWINDINEVKSLGTNIDIVGVPEQLIKQLAPSQTQVIMDVDKRSIKGGKQNSFIKTLVKDLKKKSESEIRLIMQERLNETLNISNEIILTCQLQSQEQITAELKNIEKKYGFQLLKFCADVISVTNPNISDFVNKKISGFSGWLDSLSL